MATSSASATPGRPDFYVYYQVAEADCAQAAALVRRMQATLGCGTLKRRPEASAGLVTFMEIYQAVDPAFEAILADALAQTALAPLLAGVRHTEIFIDLPAPETAACA